MRYLGYYKNGYAHGTFWATMIGGYPRGHMHGTICSRDATISGSSIAYIYPDMETTLLGKFENRQMQDAQESAVLGVDCDEGGLLHVSKYATTNVNSPHFYYEPPSNVSFGAGPRGIRDPYEEKWLELRASKNAGAGEGVYSKRALMAGELAAIYSGYVYTTAQLGYYANSCMFNITKTDDERRHCTKYTVGVTYTNNTINIPPEVDKPGMFIPSLGPKVSLHPQHYMSKYEGNGY